MKFTIALSLGLYICMLSCNNNANPEEKNAENKKDSMQKQLSDSANIKEEAVEYTSNGTKLKGYIAYNESKQGKRPIVLVVPEWWGLTDYPRMRAKQLAQLGYLAMTADMFGDGKTADNPEEAQNATAPFYKDPKMGKERLDAALAKAKTYPQADTSQTAAIGYCFGGSIVLNAIKQAGKT